MTSPPRFIESGPGVQLGFDELDTPLRDTTFVVVDLETTGGRAGDDAITEIGAVKIRGGEVLGEFATLIDPGRAIPPHIVQLTGITTAMVYAAPKIEEVLPAFLEFAEGSVLVAHNAGFDVGFLKAATARCGAAWPRFPVVCTVKLARRVLGRDEAPSVKLSALAQLFRVSTQPTHRALDDARATVDVLHALIERVGNLGVHSLTELRDYIPAVTSEQRAKRTLAAHLPRRPGVYMFRGPSDEVLYVGTAVDLHRRVRSYFTGSETRPRLREMVAVTTRIDHVECAHGLEAGVRELRLLAAHTPPYNRRSKYPMRGWWIVLTDETFPRFSVSRTPTTDAIGPFSARAAAAEVATHLAELCGVRTCTRRIGRTGTHGDRCQPEAVGACAAAAFGIQDPAAYSRQVERARTVIHGSDDGVLLDLQERLDQLVREELFENAARLRDRAAGTLLALRRTQRLAALAAVDELVAARPRDEGGWEFAVVRAGRLASAGVAPRGVPPMPVVEALTAAAETVRPAPGPFRGASPEELGLVARWLDSGGVRIVRTSHGWCEPALGAGRWHDWAELARDARAVSAVTPGERTTT
ncbi:DEDD exonuclease domain-containing protein [Rhodococcus coprophilus]|uniref:DNA polymerase III epsilon subunit n=1 Tax=Rhodococcus coprophilus TaxID=38310 RepID=A0A2X4TM59_9NOCA|nr:DEDD exonuclease domain-containing protein [Rhodococcus coprophilus]MBM7460461.1 DNA polymerase-3 subunit epsilon [Rhodococcus coprophilus]SQI28271.1 DNA polymerase III epsilon subunit [Rhodococcus coprophilus]